MSSRAHRRQSVRRAGQVAAAIVFCTGSTFAGCASSVDSRLITAARIGDVDAARRLIAAGADPDAFDHEESRQPAIVIAARADAVEFKG